MSEREQDDRPRSLRDINVRRRRIEMLHEPHIEPLTLYAAKLRAQNRGEVPEFDPLDGGTKATLLFLFEKPGPMTAGEIGSGFISRNNDDPSAEATFRFMAEAKIPRGITVTWNVIPWWNGTRKVTSKELGDGASCVRELLELLPNLCAVVLVGQKATKASPFLRTTGMRLFTSAHPSPIVRARFPSSWNRIPMEWERAMEFVLHRIETS